MLRLRSDVMQFIRIVLDIKQLSKRTCPLCLAPLLVICKRLRMHIHRIIYDELCLGQINQGSKNRYCEIMSNLVRQGVQGIILGCTEIGLLVGAEGSPAPVFDTTKIHAQAAVEYALHGSGSP